MLKNKRIDPRDTETIEWGEQISETKTCVEFEELPGRYGIRTSQIFNDAEIDVFVGEYETALDRITSGNPSPTEFYASGGMAYIIVNAAHVGQAIRADYYPGGSVLTAEVLASSEFKGPQGDAGPQGPQGPAGAPGDVSDVENVGAGVGVFKEIATGVARFKSLVAGANIDLDTTDPDEIEIAVNSGSLVGDAINAASADSLADADKIGFWQTAGSILKSITWANLKTAIFGAINGLTAKSTPVGADVIAIGDSAASFAGKKAALNTLAGAIMPYAKLSDVKASGVKSGTFTAGGWRTRTLNTENNDTGNIVTLSSNQFTLAAGTYTVRALAAAYAVEAHQIRLQNITDGSTAILGVIEYCRNPSLVQSTAQLAGQFTISNPKTFELQHYCGNTVNNEGFGVAASWGDSIFAIVELWKVA